MAYQLWVTGRHDLSGRIFASLADAALTLKDSLEKPAEFTVQCYDAQGRFSRAFGGTAKRGEIIYNGWTSNCPEVEADKDMFKRYIASI